MKKTVTVLLVFALSGAFFLSCSSSSPSDSPAAVFKAIGNQIDEIYTILEKGKDDIPATALALQAYIDKNASKLKDLALKMQKLNAKAKDDPKMMKEIFSNALGMMEKGLKLNKLSEELKKNPVFNAVWMKYNQMFR